MKTRREKRKRREKVAPHFQFRNFFAVVVVFVYPDRVSLRNGPDCPGTGSVDPPASAS